MGQIQFHCASVSVVFTSIPVVFYSPYPKPVEYGSVGLLQARFRCFFLGIYESVFWPKVAQGFSVKKWSLRKYGDLKSPNGVRSVLCCACLLLVPNVIFLTLKKMVIFRPISVLLKKGNFQGSILCPRDNCILLLHAVIFIFAFYCHVGRTNGSLGIPSKIKS